MRLEGKVAAITGAASGFGRAAAERHQIECLLVTSPDYEATEWHTMDRCPSILAASG